eukprot:TRINITY_DN4202_c0_g2_i1.p1 TRINITY_DN4202_c0_g2~~TRINITY_DN4202_c0_g2_i1.p1  ORF type:complete len:2191 (+),score=679.11 TRINITY_DN4202_c0_g2_i1:124-6696(+)
MDARAKSASPRPSVTVLSDSSDGEPQPPKQGARDVVVPRLNLPVSPSGGFTRRPSDLSDWQSDSSPRGFVAEVGAKVNINHNGRKLVGVVRFNGTTSFAEGDWSGIELDTPDGKNDGSVKGERYFSCAADYGIFTRPKNIVSIIEEPSAGFAVPEDGFDDLRRASEVSFVSETDSMPSMIGVVDAPEGSRVLVRTRGGELKGTVRFVGTAAFSPGDWTGIELDAAAGKNDGSVRGQRYFTCRPGHGVFVRPPEVVALLDSENDKAVASPKSALRRPTVNMKTTSLQVPAKQKSGRKQSQVRFQSPDPRRLSAGPIRRSVSNEVSADVGLVDVPLLEAMTLSHGLDEAFNAAMFQCHAANQRHEGLQSEVSRLAGICEGDADAWEKFSEDKRLRHEVMELQEQQSKTSEEQEQSKRSNGKRFSQEIERQSQATMLHEEYQQLHEEHETQRRHHEQAMQKHTTRAEADEDDWRSREIDWKAKEEEMQQRHDDLESLVVTSRRLVADIGGEMRRVETSVTAEVEAQVYLLALEQAESFDMMEDRLQLLHDEHSMKTSAMDELRQEEQMLLQDKERSLLESLRQAEDAAEQQFGDARQAEEARMEALRSELQGDREEMLALKAQDARQRALLKEKVGVLLGRKNGPLQLRDAAFELWRQLLGEARYERSQANHARDKEGLETSLIALQNELNLGAESQDEFRRRLQGELAELQANHADALSASLEEQREAARLELEQELASLRDGHDLTLREKEGLHGDLQAQLDDLEAARRSCVEQMRLQEQADEAKKGDLERALEVLRAEHDDRLREQEAAHGVLRGQLADMEAKHGDLASHAFTQAADDEAKRQELERQLAELQRQHEEGMREKEKLHAGLESKLTEMELEHGEFTSHAHTRQEQDKAGLLQLEKELAKARAELEVKQAAQEKKTKLLEANLAQHRQEATMLMHSKERREALVREAMKAITGKLLDPTDLVFYTLQAWIRAVEESHAEARAGTLRAKEESLEAEIVSLRGEMKQRLVEIETQRCALEDDVRRLQEEMSTQAALAREEMERAVKDKEQMLLLELQDAERKSQSEVGYEKQAAQEAMEAARAAEQERRRKLQERIALTLGEKAGPQQLLFAVIDNWRHFITVKKARAKEREMGEIKDQLVDSERRTLEVEERRTKAAERHCATRLLAVEALFEKNGLNSIAKFVLNAWARTAKDLKVDGCMGNLLDELRFASEAGDYFHTESRLEAEEQQVAGSFHRDEFEAMRRRYEDVQAEAQALKERLKEHEDGFLETEALVFFRLEPVNYCDLSKRQKAALISIVERRFMSAAASALIDADDRLRVQSRLSGDDGFVAVDARLSIPADNVDRVSEILQKHFDAMVGAMLGDALAHPALTDMPLAGSLPRTTKPSLTFSRPDAADKEWRKRADTVSECQQKVVKLKIAETLFRKGTEATLRCVFSTFSALRQEALQGKAEHHKKKLAHTSDKLLQHENRHCMAVAIRAWTDAVSKIKHQEHVEMMKNQQEVERFEQERLQADNEMLVVEMQAHHRHEHDKAHQRHQQAVKEHSVSKEKHAQELRLHKAEVEKHQDAYSSLKAISKQERCETTMKLLMNAEKINGVDVLLPSAFKSWRQVALQTKVADTLALRAELSESRMQAAMLGLQQEESQVDLQAAKQVAKSEYRQARLAEEGSIAVLRGRVSMLEGEMQEDRSQLAELLAAFSESQFLELQVAEDAAAFKDSADTRDQWVDRVKKMAGDMLFKAAGPARLLDEVFQVWLRCCQLEKLQAQEGAFIAEQLLSKDEQEEALRAKLRYGQMEQRGKMADHLAKLNGPRCLLQYVFSAWVRAVDLGKVEKMDLLELQHEMENYKVEMDAACLDNQARLIMMEFGEKERRYEEVEQRMIDWASKTVSEEQNEMQQHREKSLREATTLMENIAALQSEHEARDALLLAEESVAQQQKEEVRLEAFDLLFKNREAEEEIANLEHELALARREIELGSSPTVGLPSKALKGALATAHRHSLAAIEDIKGAVCTNLDADAAAGCAFSQGRLGVPAARKTDPWAQSCQGEASQDPDSWQRRAMEESAAMREAHGEIHALKARLRMEERRRQERDVIKPADVMPSALELKQRQQPGEEPSWYSWLTCSTRTQDKLETDSLAAEDIGPQSEAPPGGGSSRAERRERLRRRSSGTASATNFVAGSVKAK